MTGERGRLLAPIFTTDELLAATSDDAWLRAILDVEVALAEVQADAGVIPPVAAQAIAAAAGRVPSSATTATVVATTVDATFDLAALGEAARLGGNPVIPVVAALTDLVGDDHGAWVHWGATSQDVLDTALSLVLRRGVRLVDADLGRAADACARLAEEHRRTLMTGRTLLQPSLPVTFGLTAAGWLVGLLDARAHLRLADSHLAVQLGGASGTLASLGEHGPSVVAALATRLDLEEPLLPWHTARQRTVGLATSLGIAAGSAGKIAADVALLMQAEVGEVAEPAAPGRGASSAMPQKRNPVLAAEALAAARRAHALVPVALQSLVAEHQRPLFGWHAEWSSIGELLALAGGAAARTREIVEGLTVDVDRMAANLDAVPGLLSERLTLALSPGLGRERARRLVTEAVQRSTNEDVTLERALLDQPDIAGAVDAGELASWLDPAGYLGAADVFIDRALAAHREGRT